MKVHGKSFTVYRHFENVPKGANMAMYVWLMELEKCFNEQGKLPDVVYYQVGFL
jgi:hypothetical protein